MAWGGQEEKEKEHAAGNLNAKDWYDEALQVVEKTMEAYWKDRPLAPATAPPTPSAASPDDTIESEFDRHRRILHQRALQEHDAGWAAELRRYLKDIFDDVTKETDVIEWWSVSASNYCIAAAAAYLLTHFNRDI